MLATVEGFGHGVVAWRECQPRGGSRSLVPNRVAADAVTGHNKPALGNGRAGGWLPSVPRPTISDTMNAQRPGRRPPTACPPHDRGWPAPAPHAARQPRFVVLRPLHSMPARARRRGCGRRPPESQTTPVFGSPKQMPAAHTPRSARAPCRPYGTRCRQTLSCAASKAYALELGPCGPFAIV